MIHLLTFPTSISVSLLFGIISCILMYYYWCVVRPFDGFPIYQMDVDILCWLLKRKRDKNERLLNYITRRAREVCEMHMDDGLVVIRAGAPYLIVCNEDIVKSIMKDPAAAEKPTAYKNFEFFLGKSLFSSRGDEWKKQRKLVTPSFHGSALKEYVSLMNEHAEKLVRQLADTKGLPTIKATDFIKSTSLRIFLESTLGMKSEELVDDETLKHFTRSLVGLSRIVTTKLVSPWLQWDFMLALFPYTRKAFQYREDFRKFIQELLENLLKMKSSKNSCEKMDGNIDFSVPKKLPFAQSLLSKHLEDPTFTMDDACSQYAAAIFGGFETVSITLMWCLFVLGHHQDIQEQAINEIKAVTDGDVTYEDISNLTYLDCILKETLRLYSIVPVFGRKLTKDLHIGKYKVRKDSNILVLLQALNNNPNVYPDPEKFDPERFQSGVGSNKPEAYIPFAEGSRPCIGKHYALLQLKIILCHILTHFKVVSLDRREDMVLSWEISLAFKKKPSLQFITRNR